MNETDPLILYTDASTVSIGGVLMQEQNGIGNPFFIAHILSDQATRWGIIELELYAFVYCVKQLTPYLMGKLFTAKTDHNNLVYLANSSIPKLVYWRVLLSEFRFLIQHIPGVQNVVADGLTRVMSLSSVEIPRSKRHFFVEDRIPRIFRLGEEGLSIAEHPR
jgi:hypothetical protein